MALGYHTWPQVIAGAALGASTAAAWFAWGTRSAVGALRDWGPGLPLLYATTLLGVALFAARNVLAWRAERRGGGAGPTKARRSDDGGGWSGAAPAPAAG